MDVRLTAEQQQLRDAAAKLADDLGPAVVADLADDSRIARLDKQIAATGWRSLRSDGASGVEVAIVAEEFGRRLVDTPFLGPVLADDLARRAGGDAAEATVAVDDRAIDARGARKALSLTGNTVQAKNLGDVCAGADLTRADAELAGSTETLGELDGDAVVRARAGRHVGGPGRNRPRRTGRRLRLREDARAVRQTDRRVSGHRSSAHRKPCPD